MPGPVVRDPTADEGADDGSGRHAHAEYCHGSTYLMGGEGLEKDCLGKGLHAASPDPLEDPETDQAREVPGESAEKGAEGE